MRAHGLISVFFGLLLLTSNVGAATGDFLWRSTFGGSPGSSGFDFLQIATSPDEEVVFAASPVPNGGLRAIGVVSWDAASGAPRWSATLSTGPDRDDYPRALAVSPDGLTVFVAGRSFDSASSRWALFALDAPSGALRWSDTFDGAGPGVPDDQMGWITWDEPTAIAVSPDGLFLYVTGASDSGATGYDYTTLAYVALSGTRLWTARAAGPGTSAASSLAVAPDGMTVFVTGASRPSPTGERDALTIAYRWLDGAQLWAHRFGPAQSTVEGRAILVSADSRTVYVGATAWEPPSGPTTGIHVLAYNAATGGVKFVRRATQESTDMVRALHLAPSDARLLVVAETPNPTVLALNPVTGSESWRMTSTAQSSALGSALSPDGSRLHLTGTAYVVGYPPLLYAAAVNTATGGLEWESVNLQDAYARAWGVDVAAAGGRVFFLLFLYGVQSGSDDFAILALSA